MEHGILGSKGFGIQGLRVCRVWVQGLGFGV